MARMPILVVGPNDNVEDIKAEVMSDLTKCRRRLSTWRGGMPGGNTRPGGHGELKVALVTKDKDDGDASLDRMKNKKRKLC